MIKSEISGTFHLLELEALGLTDCTFNKKHEEYWTRSECSGLEEPGGTEGGGFLAVAALWGSGTVRGGRALVERGIARLN